MSDPRAKSERSKAKDARQMPAPDKKPKRKPGKKDKPWKIDFRWHGRINGFLHALGYDHGWRKFGQYRNEAEAETVIRNAMRKADYWDYRIISPDGIVREVGL